MARDLRIANQAKRRAEQAVRGPMLEKREALRHALSVLQKLPALLEAYEGTGDHDHSTASNKPLAPGAPCPGGYCLVSLARHVLEAQKKYWDFHGI